MIHYFLTPELNTPAAFAANEDGVLTVAQSMFWESLKQQDANRSAAETSFTTRALQFLRRNPLIAIAFVVLLAVLLILLLTGGSDGRANTPFGFTLLLLIVTLVVAFAVRLGIDSDLNHPDQIGNRTPATGYVIGVMHFYIEGLKKELYMAYIADQKFYLTPELWSSLHSTQGEVKAWFIDGEHPILISIQPYIVATTPTDEQLATVVGISDDGELVYETDLHDHVPDGEVRRL
jgi:hypothetical protein